MDPISQAALGAIAARAAAPRTLAGPVLLVGAAAGAMPDIDVLFSAGGDYFDMLRTHRGITHSLFFALTVGPLLGWLSALGWERLGQRRAAQGLADPPVPGQRPGWVIAVTAAVLSHPLLDVLTPYGTQLLLPFSDARLAINAMPIVDPFYTGMLILGVVVITRRQKLKPQVAWPIAVITLGLSSAYLAGAWQIGIAARDIARSDLESRGHTLIRIDAFPTLLQPLQRQVVARTAEVDFVGLMSMWSPCPPVWNSAPSLHAPVVDQLLATREGATFAWFAMGWSHYTLQPAAQPERLVVADLRYVLDGSLADSVFSISVPVTAEARGAEVAVALAGPVSTAGASAAQRPRIEAALSHLFDPVCSDPDVQVLVVAKAPSAQIAKGQGG